MIGKGKAIAHTRASMQYGWNQEKNAEVVFSQHLVGETPKEITEEFSFTQQLNESCTKNTLSFVLSPTVEDGKRLGKKDLEKICDKFMEQMKLGERQAVAFVHRDKEHTHIHLYVNRIDFKGEAYKDSFIGKRSQQAAEKVAEQLKLTTVKQVQWERNFNLREIRTEIRRRHDLTMKQFRPTSFKDYMEGMRANGVQVIPSINKANKLQGFRFQFDNYNLKGSEVHRSMSIGNIGKELAATAGVSKFMKENMKMNLVGKVVELSGKLAISITKQAIKKAITRGFEY
jgi:hypothetical protein